MGLTREYVAVARRGKTEGTERNRTGRVEVALAVASEGSINRRDSRDSRGSRGSRGGAPRSRGDGRMQVIRERGGSVARAQCFLDIRGARANLARIVATRRFVRSVVLDRCSREFRLGDFADRRSRVSSLPRTVSCHCHCHRQHHSNCHRSCHRRRYRRDRDADDESDRIVRHRERCIFVIIGAPIAFSFFFSSSLARLLIGVDPRFR